MADDKNSWVEFNNGNGTVTLPNGDDSKTDGNLTDSSITTHPETSKKMSNEHVAQISVASHEQRSAKRSTSSGGRGSRVVPHQNLSTAALNVAASTNLAKDDDTTVVNMDEDDQRANGENESKVLKTGKLLTTVFPTNTHCAWISLPEYDPAKIPKILYHQQVALEGSTYVKVMKTITSDIRFVSYCALYSRVLPVWVMTSIFVLLVVLFSASTNGGFPVIILAFVWMLMLLIGIIFGIIIRKHLVVALRQSVKDANFLTMPKNLLVGVQDRGQLSCHKVAILFIYYEIDGCQKDVARLLQVHEVSDVNPGLSDAIAELKRSAKISREENNGRLTGERAEQLAYQLLLEYSQQYVKAYMKKQLLFPTRPLEGVSDFRPKHCAKSYCLCQFVEKEFFNRNYSRPWYEKLK